MRWEELWDAALRIRTCFSPPRCRRPERGADAAARRAIQGGGRRGALVGARRGLRGRVVRRSARVLRERAWCRRRPRARQARVGLALVRRGSALPTRVGARPQAQRMAGVVQEIVAGERSGVAFSCHPDDDRRALIEAVHGLNQGLVDGVVEPDRWTLDRRDGALLAPRSGASRDDVGGGGRCAPRSPCPVTAATRPRWPPTKCRWCTAWRGAPNGTSRGRRTWSGRCGATSSSRCSRDPSPCWPARPATGAPPI